MHDPKDHERRQPRAQRRVWRLALGLGIVALVAAAGYAATVPLGGASTASTASNASNASDAGPGATGGAVEGVAIGQSAPEFVDPAGSGAPLLVNLDGAPIRLADFAGRPLWIVFWATWCTPCQQEASDILAAYHAHRGDDLAVLAIDIQEPAAAVREFALSHELDYAIGLDPRAAVQALYGRWGLPSHFFLDGRGVIRDRYFGQMTGELMEQHLRAIIGS
jgi:peroxiredoxin